MIIPYLHAVLFLRNLQVLWDWEDLRFPMQYFCAIEWPTFFLNLCAAPHDVSFWLRKKKKKSTFKEDYFLKMWVYLASIWFPSAAMNTHSGRENLDNCGAWDILPHLHVRHILILLSNLLTPGKWLCLHLFWKSDLEKYFERQQVW